MPPTLSAIPNHADALPRRARILDIASAALLGAALWIAVVGGGRYLVFDIVVSLRSPMVFLYAAASLAIVRHLLWPRPSALARLRSVYASIVARDDLTAALRAFVATRPTVLLVGFFAVLTFGLSDKAGFTPSKEPLANLPARFDAGWYAGVALDGYTWDHTFQRQRNIAFFPAMPMLIRPLAAAFGMHDRLASRDRQMLRALWAGVAISLAAFLWALVYVARLGRELIGAERAANAALLLASYPFALLLQRAVHRIPVPARGGRRVLSLQTRGLGGGVVLGARRRSDAPERLLPERAARYSGHSTDLLRRGRPP